MVCGPTSAGYGWASASSETACAAGRRDRGRRDGDLPGGLVLGPRRRGEPAVRGRHGERGAPAARRAAGTRARRLGVHPRARRAASVQMAMECGSARPARTSPGRPVGVPRSPPGYATTGGAIGVVNLTEALCPDGARRRPRARPPSRAARRGQRLRRRFRRAVRAGHVRERRGRGGVPPCAPGTFASSPGSTLCVPCGSCDYAPFSGSASCAPPAGSIPDANLARSSTAATDGAAGPATGGDASAASARATLTRTTSAPRRARVPRRHTADPGMKNMNDCVAASFGDDDFYKLALSSTCGYPGGCYSASPCSSPSPRSSPPRSSRAAWLRVRAAPARRQGAPEGAAQGGRLEKRKQQARSSASRREPHGEGRKRARTRTRTTATRTRTTTPTRATSSCRSAACLQEGQPQHAPPPPSAGGVGGSNPMRSGARAPPPDDDDLPPGWEEHTDDSTGRRTVQRQHQHHGVVAPDVMKSRRRGCPRDWPVPPPFPGHPTGRPATRPGRARSHARSMHGLLPPYTTHGRLSSSSARARPSPRPFYAP